MKKIFEAVGILVSGHSCCGVVEKFRYLNELIRALNTHDRIASSRSELVDELHRNYKEQMDTIQDEAKGVYQIYPVSVQDRLRESNE